MREINLQLGICPPKHLVLLSAVPREAWSGTQKLYLCTVKVRKGKYLDASCVFPVGGQRGDKEPKLLPEGPEDILKLAIQMAMEQPVLFWGKSSVYEDLKD